MKRLFAIFAFLVLSCHQEPLEGTPFKRDGSYDLLSNVAFETGGFWPWEKVFGSLNANNQGKIELMKNEWGYNAVFTPSKKERYDYDLQLLQRGLKVKPGYSYKLTFGGNTKATGDAEIVFAIMNCTNSTACRDYIKWPKTIFSTSYQEYGEGMGRWKNCENNDPEAVFAISGGKSKIEFEIAVVQVSATPTSCP